MKLKIFYCIILSIVFISIQNKSQAQNNINDSCVSAHLFSASISFQVPGYDMAKYFGNNMAVGGTYFYKLRSNWVFAADFNYLFGNNIRKGSEILKPLLTSDGNIINSSGLYSDFSFQERGFYADGRLGKVIPLSAKLPNSGIMIIAGAGLLQHKIRINDSENITQQISGEYKKGYDMLTNGLCMNEFIGYLHLSRSRLFNVYIGMELVQAWTKSRRDYNFSTKSKDESQHFDLLTGLKFGWIFPIYGKGKADIFYY